MGDNDWKEVNHKKRRSVFDRLKPSPSQYSKFDDLAKVSLSVYVANFPSHLTVQELWNICGKVGTLADVFIASRKNKLGQMFAFCRFIKVDNSDSLIEALANTWVGKLRLHAKVARFNRKVANAPKVAANSKVVSPIRQDTNANSYAFAVKGRPVVGNSKETSSVNERGGDPNTAMEIPLFDTNEFPFVVLGCYQVFRSIANARTLCRTEGFADVDIKYLGELIFATIYVTVRKLTYAIRVRELCSWTPSFTWETSDCEDEFIADSDDLDDKNANDNLANGLFGDNVVVNGDDLVYDNNGPCHLRNSPFPPGFPPAVDAHSSASDQENVSYKVSPCDKNANDNLANGLFGDNVVVNGDDRVYDNNGPCHLRNSPFPPGFPPAVDAHSSASDQENVSYKVSPASDPNSFSRKSEGFSVIEKLEETIKVGLALGLNMKGCESTLTSLIANIGAPIVNFLTLQETKMDHVDPWVLRQDCGSPSKVRIKWVAVYAPQDLARKIALWESIINLLNNWDGISITMGDFNEVREAGEHFGSCYNERHSDIFNNFIARASLNDVPLGGYKFTWTDKWGSKMSKIDRFLVSDMIYETFPTTSCVILEKGIPDHRPILMKEMVPDFGPTPFCLISFKKKLQNLKGVIRLWAAIQRATSSSIKKEHLLRLSSIDIKIDQGRGQGYSPKYLESNGPWKFLKKNWRQHSIKGIRRNGIWIDNPDTIKEEFKNHFQERFHLPIGFPSTSVVDMDNHLSRVQSDFLEHDFSRDEIKWAVWDCGGDRAPGLDGEMMAWHRKNKKQLMVFKVDFEKAFDSLKWDYLDLVMVKFGFGCKWRAWIKGCLRNARSSVLVNGSPSKEFEIFRGLSLSGIGMSHDDILHMANIIGCGATTLPFKYLGDPVGCIMSRCSYWDPIINKFSSRLDLWKARLLSVGGRLTLIKSVLGSLSIYFMSLYKVPSSVCNRLESMRNHFFIGADLGEKKMTWVNWKKCLASKKMGGLGIGSIFALNVGFLFKWVWRFFCNPPDLWIKVIKEFYGPHGGLLGGAEMSQLDGLCSFIANVDLSNHGDSWSWAPAVAKGFSVASIRSYLDLRILYSSP
uniref:RNA-directed DNA polymerase, eukaryota n=1 Tax=Tanacetum cinerariifolium TaxID=118510 RepID=A0A6L2NMV7_TANCI|nr:RNA-directed DNA polymerase, eukaryota [Tanacetum cinerariifolium]